MAAIDLPNGATVMDACSAPGMKTTQIAASGAAKVGKRRMRVPIEYVHNYSEENRLYTYIVEVIASVSIRSSFSTTF